MAPTALSMPCLLPSREDNSSPISPSAFVRHRDALTSMPIRKFYDDAKNAALAALPTQSDTSFVSAFATSLADSVNEDDLCDRIIAFYDDCMAMRSETRMKNEKMAEFLRSYKPIVDDLKRKRVNADDFVLAKKLGHGAFGQVHLVRERGTGKLYALKKMFKAKLSEGMRYREEKTVLSETQSPFLTSLKASFQDDECLYLLMEYCAGGDLLRLMTTYDDEKMPEPDVKFYAAEVLMSIAALHAAGYAHRDVKPENVILDAHGHVKMADFGSCIKVGSDGLIRCAMAVGTADYSSPEVLDSMNVKNPTYGRHCDFWALGVLIFEMLHGCLPFNVEEIMSQILKIDGDVEFDDKETVISDDAKDLICKLLTKEARRLGRNGVEEIMAHPWFAGITFAELRSPSSVPPFVPALESDDDTQYFERDLLNEAYKVPPRPPPTSTFEPRNLRFHGFSHVEPDEDDDDDLPEPTPLSKSLPITKKALTRERGASRSQPASAGPVPAPVFLPLSGGSNGTSGGNAGSSFPPTLSSKKTQLPPPTIETLPALAAQALAKLPAAQSLPRAASGASTLSAAGTATVVTATSEQLTSALTRASELEMEGRRLKEKLAAVTAELDAERAAAESSQRALRTEVAVGQADLNAARAMLAAETARAKSAEAETERLRGETKALGAQSQTVTARADLLDRRLASATSDLDRATAQSAAVATERDAALKQVAALTSALAERETKAQSQVAELRDQLAAAERQLAALAATTTDLVAARAEIDRLLAKVSKLQVERAGMEEHLRVLGRETEEHAVSADQIQVLSGELASARGDLLAERERARILAGTNDKTVADLAEARSTHQAMANSLKEAIAALESKLKAAEADRCQWQTKTATLEQELAVGQAALATLAAEMVKVRALLAESLAAQEGHVATVLAMEAAQSDLAELLDMVGSLLTRIYATPPEDAPQPKQISGASDIFTRVCEHVVQLERQGGELRTVVSAHESRISTLEADLAAKEAARQAALKDAEEARRLVESSTVDLGAARSTIVVLTAERDDLQRQVVQLTAPPIDLSIITTSTLSTATVPRGPDGALHPSPTMETMSSSSGPNGTPLMLPGSPTTHTLSSIHPHSPTHLRTGSRSSSTTRGSILSPDDPTVATDSAPHSAKKRGGFFGGSFATAFKKKAARAESTPYLNVAEVAIPNPAASAATAKKSRAPLPPRYNTSSPTSIVVVLPHEVKANLGLKGFRMMKLSYLEISRSKVLVAKSPSDFKKAAPEIMKSQGDMFSLKFVDEYPDAVRPEGIEYVVRSLELSVIKGPVLQASATMHAIEFDEVRRKDRESISHRKTTERAIPPYPSVADVLAWVKKQSPKELLATLAALEDERKRLDHTAIHGRDMVESQMKASGAIRSRPSEYNSATETWRLMALHIEEHARLYIRNALRRDFIRLIAKNLEQLGTEREVPEHLLASRTDQLQTLLNRMLDRPDVGYHDVYMHKGHCFVRFFPPPGTSFGCREMGDRIYSDTPCFRCPVCFYTVCVDHVHDVTATCCDAYALANKGKKTYLQLESESSAKACFEAFKLFAAGSDSTGIDSSNLFGLGEATDDTSAT